MVFLMCITELIPDTVSFLDTYWFGIIFKQVLNKKHDIDIKF